MLIQIDNHIIDTTKIYRIEKVLESAYNNQCWGFVIHFMGIHGSNSSSQLVIGLTPQSLWASENPDRYPGQFYQGTLDREAYEKRIEEKVLGAYEALILYWGKDPIDIPQIFLRDNP